MAVLLLLFSCLVTFNSFVTPWTVAHQAPLSMGFPRQEYWSGLPFPFPGDLPNPRIELASPALAGKFFSTESPRKWSRKWQPTPVFLPGNPMDTGVWKTAVHGAAKSDKA